jgi:membrane dipeptidase
MNSRAEKIHRDAIVIDATCPLAIRGEYLDSWIKGGVTVIAPTVGIIPDPMGPTMRIIGDWLKILRLNPNKLLHVTSVGDIYRAKEENKLGIIFHFQASTPFERDLNNIEIYYRLGVRIAQICNNIRDFVGDGCTEPTDIGLSEFGLRVIGEMNRLGMVVDCAHTGYRTTMEAIEASKKPVIVSHANAKTVWDSVRNLRDDQIKAIASKGGVIGMVGWPAFVSKKSKPTLDDLLKHVDYIAQLVGVEHISIGMDYWDDMAVVVDGKVQTATARAMDMYNEFLRKEIWKPKDYPPPPSFFPQGIETPDKMPNLTAALLDRGYSDHDVKNILGLNLIRVFKEVWV